MKLAIAGATGFVGQPLVHSWLDQGHDVLVIGRDSQKAFEIFQQRVKVLTWDGLKTPQGRELLLSVDAVVNLSGASIAGHRWTSSYKQEILRSRVETTSTLANILSKIKNKRISFLSASAIGIYGIQTPVHDGLPPPLTEMSVFSSQRDASFLARVCEEWEAATHPAKDAGHRVVRMRFAVVLGKNEGALRKMALSFWLFLGGPVGSGDQPMSWISRHDLCRAVNFLLNHPTLDGAVNMAAPVCVTNKEFARILGRVIHRPAFMPVPAPILKLALGEMANELLLNGQHVIPQKLREAGFMFDYPDPETTLRCIYQK